MSDNNFSFPFQFPLPSSASHQNDQSTADLSNYLVTNTGVENAFSSPTPAQLLNEVADMEYRGLSMLDHERTIGSYPEDPNMEKYQYGYGYPYGYGLDDKKDDEMPRYIDPNALTCAPGSVFESTIEDENQSANFTSNINNNISTLPSSSSNALLFPVMKVPVQNAAGVNTPRSILLPIPTRSGLSSPTYPHQQGISGQNSNPSLSSPYTYQTSSPLSSLLQPQSPTNASSLSSLSSSQHLYTNHKGVRFVLNQNENEMKTALGSPISPRLLSLGLRAGVPGRGLMGWEGPDDYVDISTNHPSTNTAAVAPENKQGVSTRTQKKRGRDDNSDIDDKSDTGAPVNRGSTKRVRMQINSTDDADAGDGTKRLWVSPRKTRGTVARYALTSEGGKSQENEESDHSEDEDEDEAISDSGSDSDVYQPSRSPSPISSDFGENSVGHGIPSSSSIPELRGRGKTHASSTTQRKAGTGTGTTRRKKGKATGSAANALATILKMKAESTGQNVSEVGPMDGSSGYSSADPEHNGDSTGSMMRRRKNSHIPLPVPIPNLIKKSRGRKVPYVVPTAGNSGETRRRSRTASTSASPHKSKVDTGEEERMYICDVPGCGKCFVRGEHLKRHIRSLHTYDKPYPCPYDGCDKSFSRRDNLGQHVRVHLQ